MHWGSVPIKRFVYQKKGKKEKSEVGNDEVTEKNEFIFVETRKILDNKNLSEVCVKKKMKVK